MVSKRITTAIFALLLTYAPANSRPVDDDFHDNEIIQVTESSSKRAMQSTTSRVVTVETTTEYKYKDIVEAYTMEVPKVESIRHAAGTLYYTVDPNENRYEKLMQIHKDYFETPMNRNLPKNIPPPKY